MASKDTISSTENAPGGIDHDRPDMRCLHAPYSLHTLHQNTLHTRMCAHSLATLAYAQKSRCPDVPSPSPYEVVLPTYLPHASSHSRLPTQLRRKHKIVPHARECTAHAHQEKKPRDLSGKKNMGNNMLCARQVAHPSRRGNNKIAPCAFSTSKLA